MTPERGALVARVAELRAVGWTCQAIGAELGVSKNTVVGIVNRNRIQYEPPSPRCSDWVYNPYRPHRTMAERLDALHAAMDAALVRSPAHYQPKPPPKEAVA